MPSPVPDQSPAPWSAQPAADPRWSAAGALPGAPSPLDPSPGRAAGGPARQWLAPTVAALILAGLGAPLGLLWAGLSPTVAVQKIAEYGADPVAWPVRPQPEEFMAADGWFTLLGVGFGLLGSAAVWLILRSRRGVVGLGAAALGCLAAGPLAWQVGRRWGLAGYEEFLREAAVGATFDKPADLLVVSTGRLFDVVPWAIGVPLVPGLAAAAAYTLLAGWSRYPSLRPEPDEAPYWTGALPAAPLDFPGQPEDDAFWRPPPPGGGDLADDPRGGAISSDWTAPPAPPAGPAPPAPGAAAPPRG